MPRACPDAAARRARGRAGEEAAERVLVRCGLVILARNWRGGGGELDRVALDGETLVFVEVKSRAEAFPDEFDAVGWRQRRRLQRAARAFRRAFGVEHLAHRFDLVTISGAPNTPGSLRWEKRAPLLGAAKESA